MNKILNKTKDLKTELLASGITCVMMLLFFILNGIAPFGDRTILTSDLFHQYSVFLAELCDKFANGGSLLYSIQNGFGMSFLGNMTTYMLSPFNLIVLLLGKHNIQISIAIIILLKTILSAFTFTFAIKKLHKYENVIVIPFAILYALSSYFLAYYWNIMWMDAVYMLPIIAYGIYQLVHKKGYLTYTIALLYSIITNYYMGFMLCIASCIFYLFFYITQKEEFSTKEFIKSSLNFIKWSVIAGITSIAILSPGILMLSNSSATNDALSSLKILFSPISFMSNHLPFTTISFRTTAEYGYALPNVYCGLLTILMIPSYFMSRAISKKEKILSGILLVLFYFSFAFNGFNFIWHAFHMPNDLPHRFSYIYIFFLLFLAIKGLASTTTQSRKQLIISISITIACLVLCAIISAPNITSLTIIATIIFGVVYSVILLMYNKDQGKKIIPIIMTIVVALELFIPYKTSFTTYSSGMMYRYENTVQNFQEKIKENDKNFYRMELTEFALLNPSSIYNYNGITSFSSMNYQTVSYLQKKLGICSNGQNSNQYLMQTPIYNMMTSMNYILDTGSTIPVNETYFKEIFNENGIKGYESNFKTSLGFATNNPTNWDFENTSPFVVQENFANIVTGREDQYFINYKPTQIKENGISVTESNNNEYTYTLSDESDKNVVFITEIKNDGAYYAYMTNKNFAIQYTVNDEVIMHYAPTSYSYVADLGNLKAGDKVEIKLIPRSGIDKTGTLGLFICSIDNNKVIELYNTICENGLLNVEEINDRYIKATIDTQTDFIYTTVPYDRNWKVYVDGELVPHEKLIAYGNAFIGINVEKGVHTVEFKYNIPMFQFTPMLPRVITLPKSE